MESLPTDVLIQMALEYDLYEILALCRTASRFNTKLCQNNDFWRRKMQRDYPEQFEKIRQKGINDRWRELYNLNFAFKNNKANFIPLGKKFVSETIREQYSPKWANPSGLMMNTMTGWKLALDKNTNDVAYLFPKNYFTLGPQTPQPGENHPKIMLKITFPDLITEEIPWDESVIGTELHYRRGVGKVSWHSDTYEYKIEYNGGGAKEFFTVYKVSLL